MLFNISMIEQIILVILILLFLGIIYLQHKLSLNSKKNKNVILETSNKPIQDGVISSIFGPGMISIDDFKKEILSDLTMNASNAQNNVMVSQQKNKPTSMFSELIALVVFSTGCLNSPVKSKIFISFLE